MTKNELQEIVDCCSWNNIPSELLHLARAASRNGYIETLSMREKKWIKPPPPKIPYSGKNNVFKKHEKEFLKWQKLTAPRGGDRGIVLTIKGENFLSQS